ncbi:hypothetical protein EXIGLDRAFT_723219, partial [Exidia glandulosa HHB12029]
MTTLRTTILFFFVVLAFVLSAAALPTVKRDEPAKPSGALGESWGANVDGFDWGSWGDFFKSLFDVRLSSQTLVVRKLTHS